MPPVCLLAVVPLLMLAVAAPARAQDASEDAENARRPAIVLGGPSAIGFHLPLSERWALRPDASLLRTEFTVASTSTVIWNQGVGLSVIRELGGRGGVNTYLAPRLGLARTKLGDGSNSDTWLLDLSAGARAAVVSRFEIFGEAGLRTSRNTQPSGGSANRTETAGFRSAIGLNIRF
jgi:hypothetical protein